MREYFIGRDKDKHFFTVLAGTYLAGMASFHIWVMYHWSNANKKLHVLGGSHKLEYGRKRDVFGRTGGIEREVGCMTIFPNKGRLALESS